MIYEFEDQATKERVDLEYRMAEAPEIGAYVWHEGRHLRRIPTLFNREPEWDCTHVCHQLQSAKRDPENGYEFPHYDSKSGKGVFKTRREIREFEARYGFTYDG